MVFFENYCSHSDYNFSWFEGAKEQICKCGATTCRGFIGKRKALPPPPKPELVRKEKVIPSKVKRIVKGRITKVSQKQIKTQVKNGKVVATAGLTTRTKVKTTEIKVRSPAKKVRNVVGGKKFSGSKKETVLGKRKRTSGTMSVQNSPKRQKIAPRKIAKPRSEKLAKSPEPVAERPIYDTVSHRSR
jgi:[histone H3]-lysine4 N-trimethyltransferase ASH1L